MILCFMLESIKKKRPKKSILPKAFELRFETDRTGMAKDKET